MLIQGVTYPKMVEIGRRPFVGVWAGNSILCTCVAIGGGDGLERQSAVTVAGVAEIAVNQARIAVAVPGRSLKTRVRIVPRVAINGTRIPAALGGKALE